MAYITQLGARLAGFAIAAMLAASSPVARAALQTFTDIRDPGNGHPVTVTAVLSDPYAEAKPIQRFADFSYYYTAGPDWRDSTATMDDGFTARLDFTLSSPDPAPMAVGLGIGFAVDRGPGGTPTQFGEISGTLRVLDDAGHEVTGTHGDVVLWDPFTSGYGVGILLPASVGRHFTAEVTYRIVQQGRYLPDGASEPVNERYLFTGFSVDTTAVPEPGVAALALAGMWGLAWRTRGRLRRGGV